MSIEHANVAMPYAERRAHLNRRAAVRYQCAPATLGRLNSGAREDYLRVQILDLSRGGAGIVACRTLPAGHEVTLQIICPADRRKLLLRAYVARCAEHVSGGWLTGLEFVRPLTDAELDAILL